MHWQEGFPRHAAGLRFRKERAAPTPYADLLRLARRRGFGRPQSQVGADLPIETPGFDDMDAPDLADFVL
ncbi:hypothetical protein STVA_48930 [Allostella vacuolata]|nr:hypothetical protein STVA_48930 [Stella vacuolata]